MIEGARVPTLRRRLLTQDDSESIEVGEKSTFLHVKYGDLGIS